MVITIQFHSIINPFSYTTDYTTELSTEQWSSSMTYVNSPYLPSSPTLEVEDFWRIRLNKNITKGKFLANLFALFKKVCYNKTQI